MNDFLIPAVSAIIGGVLGGILPLIVVGRVGVRDKKRERLQETVYDWGGDPKGGWVRLLPEQCLQPGDLMVELPGEANPDALEFCSVDIKGLGLVGQINAYMVSRDGIYDGIRVDSYSCRHFVCYQRVDDPKHYKMVTRQYARAMRRTQRERDCLQKFPDGGWERVGMGSVVPEGALAVTRDRLLAKFPAVGVDLKELEQGHPFDEWLLTENNDGYTGCIALNFPNTVFYKRLDKPAYFAAVASENETI